MVQLFLPGVSDPGLEAREVYQNEDDTEMGIWAVMDPDEITEQFKKRGVDRYE